MELKTFFDNFETMAEAPNGVQKLREMILQLAVQGNLVPQDPNDEPASVLVEKIKTEKKRLSKEGKIKRFKDLPAISTDLFPWRLPENWDWTRLAAIGLVNPRNDVSDDIKVSFIPMKLIPVKLGENVQFEERIWSDVKQGFTHLAEGDVVCAKITPCFQNGKSAVLRNLVNGIGAGTTELHVFRSVSDEILADYVLLFLKSASFLNNGVDVMTGSAGQKRVPADYFAMRPFPLPPTNEQKRIVAKVDELMVLCDDLEARKKQSRQTCIQLNDACIDKMLAAREPARFNKHWQRIHTNFDLLYSQPENVNKLRQAILQLAVQGKLVPQDPNDEPASVLLEKFQALRERTVEEGRVKAFKSTNMVMTDETHFKKPAGWEWTRLGALSISMTNGIYKPAKYYSDTGVGCLRMYNINNGKINFENLKRMELDTGEIEKYRLHKGDLLVNRVNSRELVGKAAVVWDLKEPLVFESKNIRVCLVNNTILPFYLNIFFQTSYVKDVFQGTAKQTCGQASISQPQIAGIPTPLPPLNEQRRIVAKVDQLMALCDDLETKLQKSQKRNHQLMEAAVVEMLAFEKYAV